MKFLKTNLKKILQKIGNGIIFQIENSSSTQQKKLLVQFGLMLEVVALRLGIELE